MDNRQKILQNVIYSLIWLIVFTVPILGYRDSTNSIQWPHVYMYYLRLLPFVLLFLLNNYLLLPLLLKKRRYLPYLLSVLGTIVVIIAVNHYVVRNIYKKTPSFRVEKRVEQQSGKTDKTAASYVDSTRRAQGLSHRHSSPRTWRFIMLDSMLLLLMVGFNVAIYLLFFSINSTRKIREMESENLKAELDYLKAQINPHFFMNTLNNIHALVDIDAQKAKQSIIELSKIMRYVLYDTTQAQVSLANEVALIENYVELMKIRFAQQVIITCEYPSTLPSVTLPPLMLITLIENGFKHGISYQNQSFIHSTLQVDDRYLTYCVKNSLGQPHATNRGVGLINLRKRLELIMGANFVLTTTQSDNMFVATLKIPIQ